jgi:aconitate decarboxylase
MERAGLTAELARFIASAAHGSLPRDVIHAARRAFIDTLGVMLAGSREPAVVLVDSCCTEGGPARALFGERRLSVRDAALVAGTAGHVLDYDDVALHGHASVVLVPAILAAAQQGGASGLDALRAYAVGYETWMELALREPDPYHLSGWHPTAMLGTIAATAALASLGKLDERTTRNALAIAASFASGVIANFGTHTKPLQAGRAAANAVEAVQLARAGVEGAADALESPHGFLLAISPHRRADTRSPAAIGAGRWRLLEHGVSVKRYPVCYAAHRVVDAVIDLAQAEDLSAGDVRQVTAWIGIAPAQTLRHTNPHTGLEAKFSLQHHVAAALLERALGFAQLTDGYVRDPRVAALYRLTQVELRDEPCPEQPGMALHDRVVVETTDGRRLDSGDVRYPRGHARLPLSDAELDAKFRDCAIHGGVAEPSVLLERLHNLADLPRLDRLLILDKVPVHGI